MALPAFAAAAQADEVLCRFGDAVRRVEVRVADQQDRLPCQVVYSKGGESRVLWRARTDASFCDQKAEGLIQELESGGWTCRAEDDPRSAEAAPEPAQRSAEAPRSNGRAQSAEPAAGPDRDQLRGLVEEAVARDLARLDELTAAGRFDAEIAALGDLDGDGIDDAAVVMTYTNGSDRTQYLMAYLHQGSSYLPVAKIGISDDEKAVRGAEVEAIEGGTIRLELELLQPGDSECCPSGRGRAAFVVQDGKLVELPTS